MQAGADDFGPVNTAEEAAAAGVAEFLSALSQLTELKVLELHGINLHALADLRRSAWLEQVRACLWRESSISNASHTHTRRQGRLIVALLYDL
jgi:hypothetical protein